MREALATGTNLADIQKVATAGKGGPSQGMVTISPKPCATDTVTGNLPAFDPTRPRHCWTQRAGRPAPTASGSRTASNWR